MRDDAIRSKEDSSAKQEQLLRLLKIEVFLLPLFLSQHFLPTPAPQNNLISRSSQVGKKEKEIRKLKEAHTPT